MYSAEVIASYILENCIKDNHPISNLQLQKILYYLQKAYLEIGRTLFDDDFEAWQIGPVIPKIYYQYCGSGAMPITIALDIVDTIIINEKDLLIINPMVECKRLLEPWEAVAEIMYDGSAWDKTYKKGKGDHLVIKKEMIARK